MFFKPLFSESIAKHLLNGEAPLPLKTETGLLVQICGLCHLVFLPGLFIACNLVSLPTCESWRLFVFFILKYCFREKIKTAILEPFSKAKVFARRHACLLLLTNTRFLSRFLTFHFHRQTFSSQSRGIINS